MRSGDESLWDLAEEDAPPAQDAEPRSDGPAPVAAEAPAPPAAAAPQPPRPAAVPRATDDESDDEAVGTTAAGRAAAEALVSLGRAARSYLLYEPDNEAIRKFLDDMRIQFRTYFEQFGPMRLIIRPWEMVLGGEVVYLNRDRERSLAFRLFRDGVRGLLIHPEVPWDEITQLLGILSIRYVGIRQQEDDIVTLLWKAGFKRIEVDSVEGFVPEDEETEVVDDALLGELGEGGAESAGILYGAAPEGFDIPWPEYTRRVPLDWNPVDEARLVQAAGEDSNVALPQQCVRLLREILEVACNPVEPLDLEEAIPILREIRDFLLSEGLLSSLLEVMKIIQALPFREKDRERQAELLAAFSDDRALSRIIRSVPAGSREIPRELAELVACIPGDPVPLLYGILKSERSNTARWVSRSLLGAAGARHLDEIVGLVAASEPPVVADLLQVISAVDPARGLGLAIDLVVEADVEVQLQALVVIEHGAYDQALGQRLALLLEAGSAEVRLRALRLLEQHRERWAFHHVAARLQGGAAREGDVREIDALAAAMVNIWEERAFHLFQGWIRPRRLIERVLPAQSSLRRAAVTGLSMIPGEQAEDLIRHVAKNAHDDLHAHCMQCIVRHRRLTARMDHGS